MLKLIVNPRTDQSWAIPLPNGVTLVGSDPASGFAIAHETVSPAHCEVTVTDGAVKVRDLGSACGTFVDHAPVTEASIAPGQSIQLGEVELTLIADGRVGESPPLPPRISAAVPAAGAGQIQSAAACKYHPKAVATWHCGQCQAYFCDLCVNVRRVGESVRHLCRKCGNDCAPVEVHYAEPVRENFYELLPGVFRYPFRGDGGMLLLSGTIIFAGLELLSGLGRFVPLIGMLAGLCLGLFATGYLFTYAKEIVLTSARGQDLPPDWPDVGDWRDETIQAFLQIAALVLLCFGPAIILRWWHPLGDEHADWLRLAALAVGALFLPMGMLLLAMFDNVAALNPIPIVRSILRIPLAYLVAAGTFELVLFAYVAVDGLARLAGVPSLLTGIVMGFLELYVLSVGMRILGLLYRTHRERLGWF